MTADQYTVLITSYLEPEWVARIRQVDPRWNGIYEPARIEALRTGHLRWAALDVFAEEPLPQYSTLSEMPNVLISRHSASTSDNENRRPVDLFGEN